MPAETEDTTTPDSEQAPDRILTSAQITKAITEWLARTDPHLLNRRVDVNYVGKSGPPKSLVAEIRIVGGEE